MSAPVCACGSRGYLPPTPAPAGVTTTGMRAALDAGRVALCGCPQGQWWLSMIYDSYGSLLDRNGAEIGNPAFRQVAGVPPGMLHADAALSWLGRFAGVSQAVSA